MTRFSAIVLFLLVPALTEAQQLPQQTLAPLPLALPRSHTPQPTTAAITAADLMTRLYIFADDSMQGRAFGTPGNYKGTEYLAAEAKRIGLQPAGEQGSYFQTVPTGGMLLVLQPGASMQIDGTALAVDKDFLPLGSNDFKNPTLSVVYGGQMGAQTTLTADQVAGKLIVFTLPPGGRENPRASFRYLPRAPGAAAIAIVALDVVTPELRMQLTAPRARNTTQPPPPAIMLLGDAAANKLFGNTPEGLTLGTAGKSVAIDYVFGIAPSRNVIAVIPGSDPVLRHEYVAIGAHNDHLSMETHPTVDRDSLRIFNHFARSQGAEGGPITLTPEIIDTINAQLARVRKASGMTGTPPLDGIYNGADDDGSGSVSVLEIAEHIAAMPVKPKRSILFVWHTGEEAGLIGSTFFTDHPTVPRDSIVTQLNIDMVGRGDANDLPGGGPKYLQLIGSRRLSTELGDLIETVNKDEHHDFAFDYTFDAAGHPQQIYCRSDHYSYARYGIPITFFTTGVHSDYHQLTDEPEYIDYEHMARVDALISDIAVHVANLNHRPVVDKPKPDPHGVCRQ